MARRLAIITASGERILPMTVGGGLVDTVREIQHDSFCDLCGRARYTLYEYDDTGRAFCNSKEYDAANALANQSSQFRRKVTRYVAESNRLAAQRASDELEHRRKKRKARAA